MKRAASKFPIAFSAPAILAIAIALSLLASGAKAGPIVTQGHSFKLATTLLSQDQNVSTGDAIVVKEKLSEKDLGANCLGRESLEKDQAVIVTLADACNDLNDNSIDVITTSPFALEDSIGSLTFDLALAIRTEKKGALTTLTVPVTAELVCGGTVDVDVAASAVATVKVDTEGCVQSLQVQNAVGTGTVDFENVILDKTKVAAGKKKTSFVDPD